MGLAGRKQKQRIPADPRNLSWADDASRFGLSYLSKFGWDASQGLGSSGDGMKTHIKVQKKLDMMGIGAQHQRDPNGIAWKQNKEFEALLKRLNEGAEQENGVDGEDTKGVSGGEREMAMGSKTFVSAQEGKVEGGLGDESSVTTIKKRKHKDAEDSDASENTKRKRKKEKHKKSGSDISAVPAIDPNSDPPSTRSSSSPLSESIPKPRPMAHRARIRAAKRIAGKSASAISEILGIVPSSSMSTSTSTPAPTPPSSSTPVPQTSLLSLDNLTTSTKSVADYFKEKLLARSTTSSVSSSSAPSGAATPGLGTTNLGTRLSNLPPPDDDGEPPRRGIGSQVPAIPLPSQVPESASASASGDGDGGSNADDGRDRLTEKLRRKAERKAEKRKRWETEANQPIPANVPTVVKEQVEEGDADSVQRTSKEKKKKKCQERKHQPPAGDQSNANDDGVTKKSHEHDIPSGSLPEFDKKSKKELKKKRSRAHADLT